MKIPAPPTSGLAVKLTEWPAGALIYRIHAKAFAGNAFNPCKGRPARFSPISDSAGACVPFLYGGGDLETALFESVFHDVPVTGPRKVAESRLQGVVLSVLKPSAKLVLADLTTAGLGHLGISRAQLIDSEPRYYATTARWAEEIARQSPAVQGLYWVARRNDQGRALMLFGSRMSGIALDVDQAAGYPLDTPFARWVVNRIASDANIVLVRR